jgi:antitoxin (DNA-binding transcriptional repressor) of toxin-antitoxin stability system
MKTVNVAELKDRLSHYLRMVRRGESILVRDRSRVIARIDAAGGSAAGESDDDRLSDLEARGVVRRGSGGITTKLIAARPKVRANVVRALLRDREEGR